MMIFKSFQLRDLRKFCTIYARPWVTSFLKKAKRFKKSWKQETVGIFSVIFILFYHLFILFYLNSIIFFICFFILFIFLSKIIIIRMTSKEDIRP